MEEQASRPGANGARRGAGGAGVLGELQGTDCARAELVPAPDLGHTEA